MPTYFGFSTQNVDAVRSVQINTGVDGGAGSMVRPIRYTKKFRTVDQELVIQDFLNSLNITQGQLPGKPEYGTTLWTFVFEPNTVDTKFQLETEIKRMVATDPRLILNAVNAYPQENGILIEVELYVEMFDDPIELQILFDQNTNKASAL